jgi:hypothetical protein
MPDFHSLLNERMRIAWEQLARRTNDNHRQSQLELGERGLRGSGFELKEFARIRAAAITERGEVVWQCIAETLAALDPPYSAGLSQRLHRFAESYFPDNPAQEYRAIQDEVTRLNFGPALAGMKHEIDAASHQARRVLMLKLDEEMLRREQAAAAGDAAIQTEPKASGPALLERVKQHPFIATLGLAGTAVGGITALGKAFSWLHSLIAPLL